MNREKPNLASQEGTLEKQWEKDFSEMRILKAEWLITRRCNINCGYCRIRDDSTLKDPEMDTEGLVRTVKMFGELWPGAPMVVYGGEPTLRDDLPDLLRAGKEAGVKLPVISNGVRVVKDLDYAKALVEAGLENWSVSLDALTQTGTVDRAAHQKALCGLQSLIMFRDAFGIRDLVACVTVTKHNILRLPRTLSFLTQLGVHGIFTPLHIGGPEYEYGQGSWEDMPSQKDIDMMSTAMYEMVKSGEYLCSNDAEWFETWPKHFLKQDWICNDKGLVTIDADGSLKYCVDIPFRQEDRMHVHELETSEGRKKWLETIQKGPDCKGCLWNPAYECIKRSRDPEIGVEEGRRRSRHCVPDDQAKKLFNGAGRWFKGNPELVPVEPKCSPKDAILRARNLVADLFPSGQQSLL